MIEITVDKSHEELTLISQGHAEYNPGNDIVCSAVSALLYTLAGALQNLCGYGKRSFRFEAGDTEIHCRPPDKTAITIFDTTIIGLLQIEKQYPDNVHITINE